MEINSWSENIGEEFRKNLNFHSYDYSARFYDPALGRWHSIDPLSEDYFEKTPYMYAGNNPIMFVDYDGRDFGIYIDHENNTITIRSHYIVNSNDSGLMNDIASYWNGVSGNNVFSVGEGADAQGYTVNFEVTVEVDDSAETTHGSDFITAGYDRAMQGRADNPNSNEINSLVTSSDYKPFKNNERKQGTTGGNDAIVRKDAISKKDTGKHEVGHNFGMSHTTGLMNEYGGSGVMSRSVGETLSRVGLGSVRYGSREGASSVGSINGVKGTAPANFTYGSVLSKQKFDRRKNRAIRKAEKKGN